MIYLPIRNVPVAQNKVWWLLCLLCPAKPPQLTAFDLVLLINHYSILLKLYFYPSLLHLSLRSLAVPEHIDIALISATETTVRDKEKDVGI